MEARESAPLELFYADCLKWCEPLHQIKAVLGMMRPNDEFAQFDAIYQFCKHAMPFLVDINLADWRKSYERSEAARLRGNGFFMNRQFRLALKCYNEALRYAPWSATGDDPADVRISRAMGMDGSQRAKCHANRSAVFFEIANYELCCDEIDRALANDYPEDAAYRLIARKGKACIALGRLRAASRCVETIEMLLENVPDDDPFLKDQVQSTLTMLEVLLQQAVELQRTDSGQGQRSVALPPPREGFPGPTAADWHPLQDGIQPGPPPPGFEHVPEPLMASVMPDGGCGGAVGVRASGFVATAEAATYTSEDALAAVIAALSLGADGELLEPSSASMLEGPIRKLGASMKFVRAGIAIILGTLVTAVTAYLVAKALNPSMRFPPRLVRRPPLPRKYRYLIDDYDNIQVLPLLATPAVLEQVPSPIAAQSPPQVRAAPSLSQVPDPQSPPQAPVPESPPQVLVSRSPPQVLAAQSPTQVVSTQPPPQVPAQEPPSLSPENSPLPDATMAGPRHPKYPNAAGILIEFEPELKGKGFCAAVDILPGTAVIREHSLVKFLNADCWTTHCFACFTHCGQMPLPCRFSPAVVFCTERCMESQHSPGFHQICEFLPYVSGSDGSATRIARLAFALIAGHRWADLDRMFYGKDSLFGKPEEDDWEPSVFPDNMQSLLWLARSAKADSDAEWIWQHGVTALFVCRVLGGMEFCGSTNVSIVCKLGALVLRAIKVLDACGFCCHENVAGSPAAATLYMKDLGVFLAPTVSRLNHGCVPNVAVQFDRGVVTVRSLCALRRGEELCLSYGPDVFTTGDRVERMAKLKAGWGFVCACDPCAQNWPPMNRLPSLIIRCSSCGHCSTESELRNGCPKCKRPAAEQIRAVRAKLNEMATHEREMMANVAAGDARVDVAKRVTELRCKLMPRLCEDMLFLQRNLAPCCSLYLEAVGVVKNYLDFTHNRHLYHG